MIVRAQMKDNITRYKLTYSLKRNILRHYRGRLAFLIGNEILKHNNVERYIDMDGALVIRADFFVIPMDIFMELPFSKRYAIEKLTTKERIRANNYMIRNRHKH